jgi:mannose PTS system EIID component
MKRKNTTALDRINVLLRCFFVQASWNFKSMLGLGFCFCIIPLSRRLFASKEERSEFLRRHLEFFNAHPYFVGFCLGAVVKLEEESIHKKWPDKRPISIFKERMTGPLGGLGDQLFWNRIKPATVAVGVLIGLRYGWIAIPIFLFIYNVPHIYMRIKSFNLSYALGFNIVSAMSTKKFKQASHIISFGAMLTAGILMAVAADWSLQRDIAVGVAFGVSAFLTALLIYYKKSINFIIFTVALASMLIGYLFTL